MALRCTDRPTRPQTAAKAGQITIVTHDWLQDPNDTFYGPFWKKFEDAHPTIHVERQWFPRNDMHTKELTLAATGQIGDTVRINVAVLTPELQAKAAETFELDLGPDLDQQLELDRAPLLEPLGEVLALEHRLQGLRAEQAQDGRRVHLGQPLRVAVDLRAIAVEDAEGLLEVGPGVRSHLLFGEHRPGLGAAARVADTGRVVAHYQDRRVAVLLEGAEDVEDDQVAQVKVRRGRVDAKLHAELVTALEALAEMVGDVDLDGSATQPLPEGPRHGG